jgi:transposase
MPPVPANGSGSGTGPGFRKMVSEQRPEELDAWLDAAESSEVAEIDNFARALRRDYEAVAATLECEWSSRQVEGQINRLKLIKRQMYERVGFDLLRQRILGAA